MHVVVAATAMVRVVRKKLISCKTNFSGMGRCGAVGHRITLAVDNVLSPAARGEKANAPHQSTPTNRKRASWIGAPKLHGLHRTLARSELHQKVEIAGNIVKRPGDQNDVLGVQAQLVYKG